MNSVVVNAFLPSVLQRRQLVARSYIHHNGRLQEICTIDHKTLSIGADFVLRYAMTTASGPTAMCRHNIVTRLGWYPSPLSLPMATDERRTIIITDEMRASFRRDGYLVVPDVLSSTQVTQGRRALAAMEESATHILQKGDARRARWVLHLASVISAAAVA